MPNTTWLKNGIKLRLIDQFKQNWLSNMENSPKGITYKLFKNELHFEKYLDSLEDRGLFTFCKFRTLNHKLPIECGRWQRLDRNQRLCNLCSETIGDEFHYIFDCNVLNEERKLHINKKFYIRPNILKFGQLFTSSKQSVLRKLISFIRIINSKVSSPG